MPTEIPYIFRKIQGSTPSGFGARSVYVDRLPVRLAVRQKLFLKSLKFASGLSQRHLATLNTVIGLLVLYQYNYGGFCVFGFYEGCLSRQKQ